MKQVKFQFQNSFPLAAEECTLAWLYLILEAAAPAGWHHRGWFETEAAALYNIRAT